MLDSVVTDEAASSRQQSKSRSTSWQTHQSHLTSGFASQLVEDSSALFVFPLHHPIRAYALEAEASMLYQALIALMDVLHLVLLCVLKPSSATNMPQPQSLRDGVAWCEVVVSFVLVADLAIRFVAHGVVGHEGAFLRRSAWNPFLAFSTLVSALQLHDAWRFNSWIRSARCIRSLHLLCFHPALRRVVHAVKRAAPLLLWNLVLVVYVMGTFSIVAVMSWTGSLDNKCFGTYMDANGAMIGNGRQVIVNPVGSYPTMMCLLGGSDCLDIPCGSTNRCPVSTPFNGVYGLSNVSCDVDLVLYTRRNFNFNNMATAMLVFLRVVSLDTIVLTIADLMAMSGKPFALFVVVFVIISSFLCLHLFLAILIDVFALFGQPAASSSASTETGSPSKERPAISMMASLGLRDEATQVCETDEVDGAVLTEGSVLFALNSHIGKITTTEAAVVGAADSGVGAPPGGGLSASDSSAMKENLSAWTRRIPLPFIESLRRRGFWATLMELECTTSRPVINGYLRVRLVRLIHSRAYVAASLVLTVMNVVCLCSLFDGMSQSAANALVKVTIAGTLWFAPPLAIRFATYGFRETISDAWNIIEVVAIGTSLFELAAPELFEWYHLLRGLRTLRLLRVGKYISPLERFTRSIFPRWMNIVHTIVILGSYLLCFAATGMVLFGGSYSTVALIQNAMKSSGAITFWDPRMTRDSFDTLWESLLMCFMIISGDRWTARLQVALQQDTPRLAASVVFFLVLYVITNYLVLNTMTVLLTESTYQTLREEAAEVEIDCPPLLLLPEYRPRELLPADRAVRRKASVLSNRQQFFDVIDAPGDHRWTTRLRRWLLHVSAFRGVEKSFGIFSAVSDVRVVALTIVGSTLFRLTMLAATVVNAVLLMFFSANNSENTTSNLNTAFLVLLVLYWFDILLKMTAFGVLWPPEEMDPTVANPHAPAFFRDPWNAFDFVVNVLCLSSEFYPSLQAAVALRTLRIASWSENTRRVLAALIRSLPQVFSVFAVIVYFVMVFGVLGVQLFGGRFYRCSDNSITVRELCVGNATLLVAPPSLNISAPSQRMWKHSDFHFDTFPSAALSLLVVGTGGSWTLLMYDGMDVAENPSDGLTTNSYPLYAIYFVAAYAIINMFALRLTVAVLINFFAHAAKEQQGSTLLTDEQMQYVKARDTIELLLFEASDELMPYSNAISQRLHRFLSQTRRVRWLPFRGPLVNQVVWMVAAIASILIVTTHRDALDFEKPLRDVIHLVCLGVFVLEAAARLAAYGPQQYVISAWNIADILMLPLLLTGYLFDDVMPVTFFRAVVLLKLMKGTELEKLVWSVVKNLMQYLHVLFLLFLVFFVYAVVGVVVFGPVPQQPPYVNKLFNFEDVPSALLVLFCTATGRSWENFMNALAIEAVGCNDEEPMHHCGSQTKTIVFFVTFSVLAAFAVLHVLNAVVVEIFRTHLDKTDPMIAPFFEVKDLWLRNMGHGCSVAHIDDFLPLIPEMPVNLTGLSFARRAAFMRFVSSLQIPVNSKLCVRYRDVIRAFVWRRFKIETKTAFFVFQEAMTSTQLRGSETFTVAHVLAARIIQRMYQESKRREREAFRMRLVSARRQMLRRRGSVYDDGDESFTGAADAAHMTGDEQRRHSSQTMHQRSTKELLDMLHSLKLESPTELRVVRDLPDAVIPAGAAHIPDSSIFAFGAWSRHGSAADGPSDNIVTSADPVTEQLRNSVTSVRANMALN